MRFLITADIHLNERRRIDDFVKNLKAIETLSAEINPDVYVIAGDIFDKRKPSPLELKIFAEHLHNVKSRDKQLIIGNHDEVGDNLTTLDWCNVAVDKVRIYKIHNKTIYFGHRTLSEATLGPKEIHINGISWKKLNYDVIVTGHIHKPQILNKENPLVLIPGSIERVNFGERNEQKYVWSLDVTNKIELKRYDLECRPMYYIIHNLETKETIINDVKSKMINIEGAIIKVTFVGKKATINKLNYDKLLDKFSKAYSIDLQFEYSDVVVEMNKETKIVSDAELLDNYCKDNRVTEQVEKIARKILNG
jgi:putative phosphoesterase